MKLPPSSLDLFVKWHSDWFNSEDASQEWQLGAWLHSYCYGPGERWWWLGYFESVARESPSWGSTFELKPEGWEQTHGELGIKPSRQILVQVGGGELNHEQWRQQFRERLEKEIRSKSCLSLLPLSVWDTLRSYFRSQPVVYTSKTIIIGTEWKNGQVEIQETQHHAREKRTIELDLGFGISLFGEKNSIYALKNEHDFGRWGEGLWAPPILFRLRIASSNEKFASVLNYIQ